MATAYDRVAYPTTVFPQTHPERLAILAKLAGLDPPDPARSRILEVGGGNCVNLLALVAAWPECEAHGFDLSEAAIARGQDIVAAAGLPNVTLAVEDIMYADWRYSPASFDYVIVHGVYAWVPPAVRQACMELVARVLSPNGVAVISYNCMPGGHVRRIMREMLLAEVAHIDDPDQKIAATRDFLENYARPQPDDEPLATTLRQQAASMLQRPDAVLFHDELGEWFEPQSLQAVVSEAAEHGLRHLTDAGRNRHLDGFIKDGEAVSSDPDGQVLRAAIRDDYASLRYFRQTAFVREECEPDRTIQAERIANMYFTTNLQRQEDGSFVLKGDTISIPDEALAAAIARAAERSPQRTPLAEIATNPEQLRVVLQLFAEWYVTLHLAPAPFVAEPGERPETSPLVRGMLSLGERMICTLDHGLLNVDQAELRALLMAADGTRTIDEIAGMDHGIPADEVEAALTASAERALLRR